VSVRFAGYAAVFDRVDRGGDVVRAGAFGTPGAVPLLWQHGGAAVGVVERVEEDARGLRVIGRVDDARLAELVRAGAVDGLSFGYRVRGATHGRVRELILRDPYSNKPFVNFYATKRVGGCVANSEAIKVMKFAAAYRRGRGGRGRHDDGARARRVSGGYRRERRRLGAIGGGRAAARGQPVGGAGGGLGIAAGGDPAGRDDAGGASLRPSRRGGDAAGGGDGAVAALSPDAARRRGAGMMEAVLARGEAIAAEAREAAIARVAAAAGEALPGVTATPEAGGVALSGRGLARRALDEPALRWIGSLVR